MDIDNNDKCMDLNGTVKTLKNILIAPCSAARRTAAAFVACTFLPDFTTEVNRI